MNLVYAQSLLILFLIFRLGTFSLSFNFFFNEVSKTILYFFFFLVSIMSFDLKAFLLIGPQFNSPCDVLEPWGTRKMKYSKKSPRRERVGMKVTLVSPFSLMASVGYSCNRVPSTAATASLYLFSTSLNRCHSGKFHLVGRSGRKGRGTGWEKQKGRGKRTTRHCDFSAGL